MAIQGLLALLLSHSSFVHSLSLSIGGIQSWQAGQYQALSCPPFTRVANTGSVGLWQFGHSGALLVTGWVAREIGFRFVVAHIYHKLRSRFAWPWHATHHAVPMYFSERRVVLF